MGGTASILHGILSPRINQRGNDEGGRWSWFEINGKNNRVLCIISAYRVCKQSTDTSGDNTAWRLQERYLISKGILNPDPRQQMLKELQNFIQTKQEKKRDIFLLMDANEEITPTKTKYPPLHKFMTDCGLMHCMQSAYPDAPLPVTYVRGRKCIDHIMMSPQLINTIRLCGTLPAGFGYESDHRLIYCDLDLGEYLGGKHSDETNLTSRVLQKSRLQVWTNYQTKLRELYTYHRIYEKSGEIYQIHWFSYHKKR